MSEWPWLVIGGDGLIGGGIVSRLRDTGRPVLATSRRPIINTQEMAYLDLGDPQPFELPWKDRFVVLIAAGCTSLNHCRNDPEGSRRMNVVATDSICQWVTPRGGFVIVLSTNLVFDGQHASPTEDSATNPLCEYGRQKLACEQVVRQSGSGAVVRLTKVFGPRPDLLQRWHQTLSSEGRIKGFSDMTCSPMSLDDVLEGLLTIGDQFATGTWHLSGTADLSYETLAQIAATSWGFSKDSVLSSLAAEKGIPSEHRPPQTQLSVAKIEQAFGWRRHSAEEVVRSCASDILKSAQNRQIP